MTEIAKHQTETIHPRPMGSTDIDGVTRTQINVFHQGGGGLGTPAPQTTPKSPMPTLFMLACFGGAIALVVASVMGHMNQSASIRAAETEMQLQMLRNQICN